METKKRFKMYKSGKKWLVAAIVAGGIATAGSVASANADEVATTNAPAQAPQTEQVQESVTAATSTATKADSNAANVASTTSDVAPSSAASSSEISTSTDNKVTKEGIQATEGTDSDDKKKVSESAAQSIENNQKDLKTNDDIEESTKNVKVDKQDSGTVGTVNWTLDDQGTLHLNSGHLNLAEGNQDWNKDDVNTIQFDGDVYWQNNGTDEERYFSDYDNLTKIINADRLHFENSDTILFAYNPQLKAIEGIEKWDTSHLTSLGAVFAGDQSLNNLNLSSWDTSQVTEMNDTFSDCTSLSNLNVTGWDVSRVNDFYSMFYGTTSLNKLDLSSWKTSVNSSTHGFNEYVAMFTNSAVEHLDLSEFYVYVYMDLTSCSNLKSVTIGPVTTNAHFYLPGSGEEDKKWRVKSTGKVYNADEIDVLLNENGSNKLETYTLVTGDDNSDNSQANNDKNDSDSNNSGQNNGKDDTNNNKPNQNDDKGNADNNKPDQNDGKNDANNNQPSQNDGKNNTDNNQPSQNDGKDNAGNNSSNANDVNNGKHANADATANNGQATDTNNQQNGGAIVDPNGGINNGSATDHAGAQSNAVFAPQDRANGQTRSNQATAKTLPQTNEKKQSTTLLSVIGLAMLSLLAVVGLVKKPGKN
ncbi:BspA family leucine-rich repeat surface protein [Pediococcus acidilactici]